MSGPKHSRTGIRLVREGEVTMTKVELLQLLTDVYTHGLGEAFDELQDLAPARRFADNTSVQQIVKRLGLDKA